VRHLGSRGITAVWQGLGEWISRPTFYRGRCCLTVIAVLALLSPRPTSAATSEFEGPYAVRVLRQGLALEISGNFSWALPQQVGVALAETPTVRFVYLDSPGGHIKAALEVAELIHSHNLDTYVNRMCASACTIAFLAGHQRFVSETGRLGFHQALPRACVAHVLRTPPQDLWIPDLGELRKAGIVTAITRDAALTVSTPGPQRELIEKSP
jgi:membrane-bound ClpP family serine protease